MSRLQPLFQQELNRIGVVQSNLGSREQLLSQVQTQMGTEQTNLQSALSDQINVNMASALTQLTQLSNSLQATLQVAATSISKSVDPRLVINLWLPQEEISVD